MLLVLCAGAGLAVEAIAGRRLGVLVVPTGFAALVVVGGLTTLTSATAPLTTSAFVAVGMVGVVLLFGLDLSGSSDQLVGGLMVLAASLCYAIGAMLFKHKLPGAPPVGVAAGQMAVAALVTLPLCLANLPDHAPSLKAAGSLVLLGAAGTGVAFLWFYTLISEIGPARASVISYIAPGFSVVYGIVLLGEGFSVAAIAGLGLILAGSWLAVGGRGGRATAREGAAADPTAGQEAGAAVASPAPVGASAER